MNIKTTLPILCQMYTHLQTFLRGYNWHLCGGFVIMIFALQSIKVNKEWLVDFEVVFEVLLKCKVISQSSDTCNYYIIWSGVSNWYVIRRDVLFNHKNLYANWFIGQGMLIISIRPISIIISYYDFFSVGNQLFSFFVTNGVFTLFMQFAFNIVKIHIIYEIFYN